MKPLFPRPRLPGAAAPAENLGWLLAALALVAAPHALNVPVWVTALALTVGLWRLAAARRAWALPPRWLLMLVTFAGAAGVYLTHGTVLGRDAGASLLLTMLALKLLETRGRRDFLVIAFLAYFLVITHFLFTQSMAAFAHMLAAVLAITTALVDAAHPGKALRRTAKVRLAGVLMIQALPLAILFFLLFPRLPTPLWGLGQDTPRGITGLSDSMSPGSISTLGLSDDIAFRANFEGTPPPRPQRYWRGPVFGRFDGRTWSTIRRPPPGSPGRIDLFQPAVEYTVTLEPHEETWLFALDFPGRTDRGALNANFQLVVFNEIVERIRYRVVSYLNYRAGIDADFDVLAPNLDLPDGANPRTLALAAQWAETAADDQGIVERALTMFRREPFSYTLEPPPLGVDPVDEFLFEARAGFCEHYASAFTVLMRAAGVPARVVTGYQGGELNPIGGYMVVRQSDAHAWSEVWLEDQGWVRVDPTAAVAPERVEGGLNAALPDPELLPGFLRGDAGWLRRMHWAWDAVVNGWDDWVVGYSADRQRSFLSDLGIDVRSWRSVTYVLAGAGIALLAVVGFIVLRPRRQALDPAARAYRDFCGRLARRGIERAPGEGPNDFADRALRARPDLGRAIRLITRLYVGLRYGATPRKSWETRLRRLVTAFRP